MTDEYVRVDDVKELIKIALEQNEDEAIKRIKIPFTNTFEDCTQPRIRY